MPERHVRRCEHAGGACLTNGKPTPGTVHVLVASPILRPEEKRWRLVCEEHARKYEAVALAHAEVAYLAVRPLRAPEEEENWRGGSTD